jgi:ATP-dependent DNA helicase RecG
MELQDRISVIKGIGAKTEQVFTKLDIVTVEHLLHHFPRGYEVFEEIKPIQDIQEGDLVTIEASVFGSLESKRVRNLQIITGRVKDYSGTIVVTWYNMPFLKNTLRTGTKFIFRGKVNRKNGILVLEQPQLLSKQEYFNKLHILQPVYPLTAGITNNAITKAVKSALSDVNLQGDYLPLEIRKEYDLIDYKSAIKGIHFPKDHEYMQKARKRIVFDEFFIFSLALNEAKQQKIIYESKFAFEKSIECNELMESLPYQLTNAQKKVWDEIQTDLISGRIMNRLVQGDVGSGKTILAVLALLMTARNGYQGAIMVPTEVLAKQHYETLTKLLSKFNVRVILLVGSMTAKEKKLAYEAIQNQEADIIVGTHALIQEKVEYKSLAFIVTDEQHRFGVRQREKFSSKGEKPHILVMSATPIPRTLAIILYGDLDLSLVDELPSNRLPIKNCVVNTQYRPAAYRLIEKEILAGRQAYIICPMVEECEEIEAENVIEYTEKLQHAINSNINIAYLHGKMKPKEKNDIMERFEAGQIQVLVSTTVVEVGVNVPNATVMVIENAERFGLAQLHQLRGRVGRGSDQSYCIFISDKEGKETKERLGIMNQSNDGFFIASEDLKLRGPGDLFGTRQSGILEFKMADIYTDAQLLKDANEAAKSITQVELESMCKKFNGLQEKIDYFFY